MPFDAPDECTLGIELVEDGFNGAKGTLEFSKDYV